jgi:hypothetical protein
MSYMPELSGAGVSPEEYRNFLVAHKANTGVALDFDTCLELVRQEKLKTHYFTVIHPNGETCGHKHTDSYEANNCLCDMPQRNTQNYWFEIIGVKKSIPPSEIKPCFDRYEKSTRKDNCSFEEFLNEAR